MKIHKVDQCCCGCSLEVGTKIIAWLEIIFGALSLLSVVSSILIDQYDDTKQKDSENDLSFDNNDLLKPLQSKKDIETIVYCIVGAILSIIFGVVLLVGATKKRPHLLKVWIIIAMVELVLSLVGVIVQVILALIAGQYVAGLIIIMVSIVGFLLPYYYIVVVSSFRDEILSGVSFIKV